MTLRFPQSAFQYADSVLQHMPVINQAINATPHGIFGILTQICYRVPV